MKDEEMAEKHAEEYRKTFRYYRAWHGLVVDKSPSTIVEQSFKEGFLAGLKAGRPKLHYLTENPNDLPIGEVFYWFDENPNLKDRKVYGRSIGYYNPCEKEWHGYYKGCPCRVHNVIAWCEIPTFDKE